MKKEIIVGVTAAILASIITYFATSIDRQLTKVQLQEIADNIVNDNAFSTVLLNEFSKDSRFTPKDGKDGLNGKNGLNGRDGQDGIRNVSVSGTNWCADMGSENQVCWGYSDLSTNNTHTRNFSFNFATPFSSAPVVTNGINANSSGWAFSVYQSQISSASYSGSIVEHTSRKNATPVKMNYIAIGKK